VSSAVAVSPVTDFSGLPKDKLAEMLAQREAMIEELSRARTEYLKIAPHLTFVPNPSQYRWLQMIQKGLDEGKMKFGVFDGNSAGKTLWLVQLIYAIMCPKQGRNPWFDVPFITNWEWGKDIRLVCKSTDLSDQTGMVWKLISDWWPKSEYTSIKQGFNYAAAYTHKITGFTLSVRTFDQPIEQHDDGFTQAAVFFNEPPPSSVWNSYPARLRGGGFMLATATLVRESEFFKDDVIDNPKACYSMGDLEGNCLEHSSLETIDPLTKKSITLRGTLKHANLENIIANSPARERLARKTGRPIHLSGAAFNVTPEVHFIPRSQLPKLADCSATLLTLDPHQRRPWAINVMMKEGFGNYFVADEWPKITTEPWKIPYHKIDSAGVGRQVYVDAIKKLKENWNIRDINCVIDSKFAGQMVTENEHARKLREILMYQHKLYFQSGATNVAGEGGGIDVLEGFLAYDHERPVEFGNMPRLFVCDDLWNSCHQLQNVIWDEFADPDRYGQNRKLDEKYLDYVRLIMYGLMHRASHNRAMPNLKDIERQTLDERWKKVSSEFPVAEVSATEDQGSNFISEVYYV
jgi:hypothetical protein